MIKLPKEVNRIIKAIEDNKGTAYAMGACVREALQGGQPLDWDIYTDVDMQQIKEFFPQAESLKGTENTARLDYSEEGNEEGIIVDIRACKGTAVEDLLKKEDFTINAVADNPSRALVDPLQGREDIKARLIKTTEDPKILFVKKPHLMLQAIRLAAQLDFDLHMTVFEGIKDNLENFESVDKGIIREELLEIMGSEHAGKGLRMLAGTELIRHILGEDTIRKMGRHALDSFDGLVADIHKTLPVAERRLGLLYLCFDSKYAAKAVKKLEYEAELQQNLMDAIYLSETMYFMADKHDLKEFLVKHGAERYEYLHNLAKAQRIVYDLPEVKIMNRHHMMADIINNGEPIYVEDLAIDGNDIIEAGIGNMEQAQKLLLMLTDIVHRKPKENTREILLKYAAKFAKNKPAATFRKVKWLK